jgi:hypothetical protein
MCKTKKLSHEQQAPWAPGFRIPTYRRLNETELAIQVCRIIQKMTARNVTDGKLWVEEIKRARCGEVSKRAVARQLQTKADEVKQYSESPVYPALRILDSLQRGMDDLELCLGGSQYVNVMHEIQQRLAQMMVSVSKEKARLDQEISATKSKATCSCRFLNNCEQN